MSESSHVGPVGWAFPFTRGLPDERLRRIVAGIWASGCFVLLLLLAGCQRDVHAAAGEQYEYRETRELVDLVNDAAKVLQTKGEAAFGAFRRPGSRWRQDERYIFVVDPRGKMLVHPDQTMEGKNQIDLTDVNGKPIIRGLIEAATTLPDKPEGWYHYQWPVPRELLPRWKSSYVRLVTTPSGNRYVVGSGIYNDRMERSFVVDEVRDAVGLLEKNGKAAFPLFRDPKGPFIAKDAYIFVFDPVGIDLVNPAFPSLEGRKLLDLKDSQGKPLVREMLKVVETRGSGWVDYMWPKPGESVPTQKSAFVSKAKVGDSWLLVGSGVYLPDAPKAARVEKKLTAPELRALVRDGAEVLDQQGEKAYSNFRRKGSRWHRDDTYFFVWTMDGTRTFHAADPALEGSNARDTKDVLGRPYGRMVLDAAKGPTGEGWVHYMYPQPGKIFPVWKSTFVKMVTFPSGKSHVIGSGIYNMEMDPTFIEDVVLRASALVAEKGTGAFAELRDKNGPFFFMDSYVFVDSPEGIELVNPAQPSLEGRKLSELKDANGEPVVAAYIDAAMKNGDAWVEYSWYKPGTNTPARKQAYVKRVYSGRDTYIVGSGLYVE